ncbi:MAG: LacI family transcriptional regulator [Chitinophagaceae bacterium]|nr:LacI family transcriptional regulator [Chitinophagaceae bacterium]
MTNTTLKKISEVLGFSISTISRALKNHPDISIKTKQKVIELALALDYEPNASAVQLRTRHSKIFGVMVPTISNFFYDSFIASVEEESRKQGFSLIILQSGDNIETENENLKLCRQNRVSGLFACLGSNTKDISGFLKMKEQDIKTIFFDKVPEIDGLNKVCMADTRAGEIAAETILRAKKKTVLAIFGNTNLSITKKRETAFCATFKSKNSKTKLLVEHASNSESARKIVSSWLNKKILIDTIFCMSDEILIGALKAIQEKGFSIPADISIIAISNGFIPGLYHPSITYVETSGYQLGKLAFTQMMACLAGSDTIPEQMVEAKLVNGGSI